MPTTGLRSPPGARANRTPIWSRPRHRRTGRRCTARLHPPDRCRRRPPNDRKQRQRSRCVLPKRRRPVARRRSPAKSTRPRCPAVQTPIRWATRARRLQGPLATQTRYRRPKSTATSRCEQRRSAVLEGLQGGLRTGRASNDFLAALPRLRPIPAGGQGSRRLSGTTSPHQRSTPFRRPRRS